MKTPTVLELLFHDAQQAVANAKFAIATAKAAWPLRNRDIWHQDIWNQADQAAITAIRIADAAVQAHRAAEALERAGKR